MAIVTTTDWSQNMSTVSEEFVFENYGQRIAISVMLLTISAVGIVGNIVVILAVVFSRKLRSITYSLIANLACADLLTCLSLPLHAVAVLSRGGWPLPTWICRGISVILFTCAGSSAISLAFIAHNRWYLLTQSQDNPQKFYSKRNTCLLVIFAWVYPCVLTIVPHFAKLGRIGYSVKYKMCAQDNTLPTSDFYSLIAGVGVIIPVFNAIVIIYIRIYRFVSRHNAKRAVGAIRPVSTSEKVNESNMDPPSMPEIAPNNTTDTSGPSHLNASIIKTQAQLYRQRVKVTKRLAIVVFAYFLCFLPFGVSVAVPTSDPGVPWTFWMATISNCINPIIYARTMPAFREVMISVVRCRLSSIPQPIECIRHVR